MVNQLTKNATLKELEEAGFASYYADHNKEIYPVDASCVPFTATYFAVTADPLADLMEDMAVEQKARAVYENLIGLTIDEDVLTPLLWFRQKRSSTFQQIQRII